MCAFGVFIAVRGTDAPVGSNLAHSNRLWTTGGMGDQIAPLKTQLHNGDVPFYFASLNYAASGGAGYASSMNAGADKLVTELNYLATACPNNYLPAVVLAGHSQGADVILQALSSQNYTARPAISARARQMIRAVVAYGDPAYQPYRNFNAPGAATADDGLFFRHNDNWTLLDKYKSWGWPMGGSSQAYVYKIRSYCKTGDLFCQGGLGSNAMAIHNSYNNDATAARQWIEYMIANVN